MIYKIYTVYDSAVGAYLQPFFLQSKGQAIRAFTDLVNDPQHQFAKHPDDYTLFELGDYDDASGLFAMLPAPVSIGVGVEFIQKG